MISAEQFERAKALEKTIERMEIVLAFITPGSVVLAHKDHIGLSELRCSEPEEAESLFLEMLKEAKERIVDDLENNINLWKAELAAIVSGVE